MATLRGVLSLLQKLQPKVPSREAVFIKQTQETVLRLSSFHEEPRDWKKTALPKLNWGFSFSFLSLRDGWNKYQVEAGEAMLAKEREEKNQLTSLAL